MLTNEQKGRIVLGSKAAYKILFLCQSTLSVIELMVGVLKATFWGEKIILSGNFSLLVKVYYY